ncbi:MAG TPA: hypothetical protein VLS86_00355, partial [Acidimicrobiia bacterium]|nr:hypothetical protein [Acidimicrobiia bacterium]
MLLHGGTPQLEEQMRTSKPRLAPRWLLLVTAIAMVLAACGGDTGESTTTAGSTETTAGSTDTTGGSTDTTAGSTDTTAAPDGESYQVALIYPGTADDLSWSNAWFDGAEQAMEAN